MSDDVELVQLPSSHIVELSLTLPSKRLDGPSQLAVLLHPWSWLGGRMNDPVLQFLARPLHERGFHVLRYNSRGVGRSKGRASLTGSQEAQDLREIVQWALTKVSNVKHLLLVGYSYGSLISSQHLPIPSSTLKTSHILLSYPLGPRSFLTFFRSRSHTAALSALARDPAARVLIVHGDRDDFTGAESYKTWSAQLQEEGKQNTSDSEGRVQVACIENGTHFWRDEDADEMLGVIERWLDQEQLKM